MSSLKMTFSLTSLIFLIALGLVFAPTAVMAHVVPGDDTHSPDNTAGTDHSLVSTLTVDTAYLTATNTITATVTFAPAVAAVADDNDAATLNVPAHATIDPTGFDALADFTVMTMAADGTFSAATNNPINLLRATQTTAPSTGVGAVYTVLFSLAAAHASTDDGDYYLGVSDDNTYNVDDETMNVNVKITVDSIVPTVSNIEFKPVAGKNYPQDDVWTEAFMVEFDVMDAGTGFNAITKDALAANPANVTFSDPVKVGSNTWAATATPVKTATADAAAVDITVTVMVKDKAGNPSSRTAVTATSHAPTATVMLKRPAGDPTPPVAGPEAIEKVSLTVPAKSYVIVGRTATPVGLPTSALARNLDAAGSAPTITAWATMPDLEDLFVRGGTLLLTTVKADKLDRDGKADTAIEEAKERDALITEVMAAVNEAQVGTDDYATHQWIEIYNNLPVSVGVTLNANYGTPALAAADTEVMLDRLSNVAIAGVSDGWAFTGLGANGVVDDVEVDTVDQTPNEPFVSFYRKERGQSRTRESVLDDIK